MCAHDDPTPQEQWQVTTPPEVYATNNEEEWLP